jgi:Cu(I)/Ag(I) efflux system membrane fusion protein
MTLVRRNKSDARLLPEGVVARMQFSPYRLQLAGIETAAVSYRPLVREIEALGFIAEGAPPAGDGAVSSEDSNIESPISVEIQIAERDLAWVTVGRTGEVSSRTMADGKTYAARVTEVRPRLEAGLGGSLARLRIAGASGDLPTGALATVRLQVPLAELEPYRSLPRNPPPPRKNAVRVAYVSAGHPEVVRDKAGLCPFDGTDLLAVPLTENQRLSWWCPMHPKVVAEEDGHECEPCAGMKLLPRIVTYSPPGQVLAVPQAAVVHVGKKNLVYVESAPGMFDGVFVELGSRCGDYYPVLKGLTAGQRVAASGAFLIDAETRLSSDAATGYFGASAGK